MFHIVIRAGGVGSRLWPVSRKTAPKQFHAFTSEATMLQDAVTRLGDLTSVENMYISTSAACAPLAHEQVPQISEQNIIVEPARKDTAAAIGLESVIIAHRDPEAIVASLGSDHSVRNGAEFIRVLEAARECVEAHPEYILPIGIQPLHPDTGYGYIQFQNTLGEYGGMSVREVVRFTEKPDLQTAQQFLQEGNYLWNANMFVWSVKTILDLYKEHLPEMYAQLMEISAALGTAQEKEVIDRVYPQMEQVAVDYAIIEKTKHIATLAANIGWNDIGDWSRLKDELAPDSEANAVVNADHYSEDTKNTLVYVSGHGAAGDSQRKKVVATIGVANLVIVDTGDALLIAHKDHTQRVKNIVEQLEADTKTDVL